MKNIIVAYLTVNTNSKKLAFASRFFCQFLLFFALHQASSSLYRMIASIFQSEAISTFCTSLSILLMMFFGGFIIPKREYNVNFIHTTSCEILPIVC